MYINIYVLTFYAIVENVNLVTENDTFIALEYGIVALLCHKIWTQWE